MKWLSQPAPKVVAFDVIDTCFQIKALDGPLLALGLPPGSYRRLYAESLRDAFALACVNRFQPFMRLLEANLTGLLAEHELEATDAAVTEALSVMSKLPPHPDAREAFGILKKAGIRVLALSNGAERSTRSLLKGAGMVDLVEAILSVEDVKLSKSRPEVYLYAVNTTKVRPDEVMLVACHPWDIGGALAAGLRGAYIARERSFPTDVFKEPEVVGRCLLDVSRAIV